MNHSSIHLWTTTPELEQIVGRALQRSFSDSQVALSDSGSTSSVPCRLVMAMDSCSTNLFSHAMADNVQPRKLVAFGPLDETSAARIGLSLAPGLPFAASDAIAKIAQVSPEAPVVTSADESPLAIRYDRSHPLGSASPYLQRHFCRYDFYDEWNNLGYGRTGLGHGIWDLACPAKANGATVLAEVTWRGEASGIVYTALFDEPDLSVLWFNRATGPVDGLDWAMVEAFFTDWRCAELPCNPCLLDIPYGYSGAVTMRLDCDQAIASARPLLELYRDRGVPLSLAVTTSLPMTGTDLAMIEQVNATRGAIVSHSHRHRENWGGSSQAAREEYRVSADWLQNSTTASRPDLAVSPFHQNPLFAIEAIAEQGCNAFVSGVIHNDPEYLLARAGRVPFVDSPIVSMSQQCMLHGDCYHRRQKDGLEIFKTCFDQYRSARGFFGYLDHPLSATYRYGWSDGAEQRDAHEAFLDHMQSCEGTWWANLAEALDFVRRKSVTRLTLGADDKVQSFSPEINNVPCPAIAYKQQLFQASRA